MDINGVINDEGEGYFWKRLLRKWIQSLIERKVHKGSLWEILTPIIEKAKDDHERLFWHHIYEEEEHRSDRLDILMPKDSISAKKNGSF